MNHCKQSVLFLKHDTYQKMNILMTDTGRDASTLLEFLLKLYEKLKSMRTSLLLVSVNDMLWNKEGSNEMIEIIDLISAVSQKDNTQLNVGNTSGNLVSKQGCDMHNSNNRAILTDSSTTRRVQSSQIHTTPPTENGTYPAISPFVPPCSLVNAEPSQMKSGGNYFLRDMSQEQPHSVDRSDMNNQTSRDICLTMNSCGQSDSTVEDLINVYIGTADMDFSSVEDSTSEDIFPLQGNSPVELGVASSKMCCRISPDRENLKNSTDKHQHKMKESNVDGTDSRVHNQESVDEFAIHRSEVRVVSHEERRIKGQKDETRSTSKDDVNDNSELIHMKGDEVFKCDLCSAVFPKAWRLRKHKRSLHKSGESHPNQCKECGKSFPSNFILKYHNDYYCRNIDRPHRCLQCKLQFPDEVCLSVHKCTSDPNKPISCDTCHFKTAFVKDLEVHIGKHTGSKAFKCNLCDFQTNWKKNLKEHSMKHSGLKPFSCELCVFSTNDKHNLRTHMKLKHTDKREFVCEECGKSYKDAVTLNVHKKNHSSDWLKCSFSGCQYETHWRSNLRSHLLTHARETKHGKLCELCGQTFSNKKHMQQHKTDVHKNTTYNCNLCSFTSNNSQSLNSHMRKHLDKCKTKCLENIKQNNNLNKSKKLKNVKEQIPSVSNDNFKQNLINTHCVTSSVQQLADSYTLGIPIPPISFDRSVSDSQILLGLSENQPNKSVLNSACIYTRPSSIDNLATSQTSPGDMNFIRDSDIALLKKLITDHVNSSSIITDTLGSSGNLINEPLTSSSLISLDATTSVTTTVNNMANIPLPYCSDFDKTCNIGVTSLCGESISQNGDQVYNQHAMNSIPLPEHTSQTNKHFDDLFSPFTADFLKDNF